MKLFHKPDLFRIKRLLKSIFEKINLLSLVEVIWKTCITFCQPPNLPAFAALLLKSERILSKKRLKLFEVK